MNTELQYVGKISIILSTLTGSEYTQIKSQMETAAGYTNLVEKTESVHYVDGLYSIVISYYREVTVTG